MAENTAQELIAEPNVSRDWGHVLDDLKGLEMLCQSLRYRIIRIQDRPSTEQNLELGSAFGMVMVNLQLAAELIQEDHGEVING